MIEMVQVPPMQKASCEAESAYPSTLPMSMVVPLVHELGPGVAVPLQT
jgi:hypothetical protein